MIDWPQATTPPTLISVLDNHCDVICRIGTIDLARNKLTKVDFQMFSDLRYTELINLAENQVSLVHWLLLSKKS